MHHRRHVANLKSPLSKSISPASLRALCNVTLVLSMLSIRGVPSRDDLVEYAPLRLLSFDIETRIPAEGFPEAEDYPVIQIGNMMMYHGMLLSVPKDILFDISSQRTGTKHRLCEQHPRSTPVLRLKVQVSSLSKQKKRCSKPGGVLSLTLILIS